MEKTSPTQIEKMIYIIRDQKVMLDSDLAELYEIPTGRMNEQVKRNLKRFPEDFMFQLTEFEFNELQNLMKIKAERHGGRRKMPYVFTECGVAMLSSVLSSERAISVNIAIMRTFVRLRSFLAMDKTISEKVGRLEKSTNHLFKIVFERLDSLEETLPEHPKDRKKIGLNKET
ncbi:ORF6N domain-containing protein [Peredibacter sp. HCB2-198]|uniref:ORF6N domain-containing protein n=1 Tax=Peredibacter sp. HCB2-198 TaxID=3383025 RepID=UPI0038B599EF